MGGNHSRSHALALAAASGNESAVRQLLDEYFKQQKVKQLHARAGSRGSNDLPPMVDLADEIHLDYSVPEGDFVLELAVSNNHLLIAQLLLESGAPVDQQDAQGFTALMCACHELESGPAMSRLLLKHYHADPNIHDANGNTALHFAARENQREQVALIVASEKVNIDAVNDRGETPLLLAAVNGHTSTCLALVQAGADATIASRAGHAPINFFDKQEDLQVAYRLVQANRRADVLIQVLYPFLLTSVLEVVVDYDAESYSSSMSNSCVALPRLMHHLRTTEARSQAEEKERTRKKSISIAEKNTNNANNEFNSPLSSDNDSRNQHHSATSSASIAPPSKQSVAFHLSPSSDGAPSPSPFVPTVVSSSSQQGPQAPNLKSALKTRNEHGMKHVSSNGEQADPDEVDVSFHLKYSDPLASSSAAGSSSGNHDESLLELLPLTASTSSATETSISSKHPRGNRLPTIPMTSSGAGGIDRSSRSSAFNVAEEEEEEDDNDAGNSTRGAAAGSEQPNSDDEESRERSKRRNSVKSMSQNELKGLMRG